MSDNFFGRDSNVMVLRKRAEHMVKAFEKEYLAEKCLIPPISFLSAWRELCEALFVMRREDGLPAEGKSE